MSICLKSVFGPVLAAPSLALPGIWGQLGRLFGLPNPDVDTGILLAAPKKRTSHQKKRQRQLAGNNQQKPLRNLGRCPACGHIKRAHTLCMNCVKEIQGLWRSKSKSAPRERFLNPEDEAFNYPKRLTRPTEYQEKLDKKDYIPSRPRSLVAPSEKKSKQPKLPQLLRKPYQ